MHPVAPSLQAIDTDSAYRALVARDAGADGHLYVGVTSTGVYCRPICRVRTPRLANCRFFATAAQAEAASFRPCLKCRPELAPGGAPAWSVMDASRTLARQAAQWLDARAHAADDSADASDEQTGGAATVARLAERLGVSDRHLRRIFAAEHGVSPLQYVQTRRLLLAKQLLTDSSLPVTQVALASGFRSLRRFNAAFAGSYRMSPSRLRRDGVERAATDADAGAAAVTVQLGFREPYDRAAMLRFIAARAIPRVEQVDGETVRRTLRPGIVGAAGGWLEATFVPGRAVVRLRYDANLASASGALLAAVRRWLDLDADPRAIGAALADLPGNDGARVPGAVDAFELALRAVLGQQVTVAAARTLAARLVDRYGTPLAVPWNAAGRCFPAPDAIAPAAPDDIAALGIVRSRAAALVRLAQAWPEIAPLLAPGAAPTLLIERLCVLPGIGAWTAHYVALRALGWPDAFPPGDAALLRVLGVGTGAAAERAAEARSQAWRPWRAYAAVTLWSRDAASPSLETPS